MTGSNDAGKETERAGIEFLDRELDLCQTFLDVAATEVDDAQAEAMAMQNARLGYQTVLAWIGTVRSGQEYERLSVRLGLLRERLEGN